MNTQEIVTIVITCFIGVICLVLCVQFLKMFFRDPIPSQSEPESEEEDPQIIQVIVKQSPLRVLREEDPVAPV